MLLIATSLFYGIIYLSSTQPNAIEAITALIDYGIPFKEIDPLLEQPDIKKFASSYYDSKQCNYDGNLN